LGAELAERAAAAAARKGIRINEAEPDLGSIVAVIFEAICASERWAVIPLVLGYDPQRPVAAGARVFPEAPIGRTFLQRAKPASSAGHFAQFYLARAFEPPCLFLGGKGRSKT
jgi:hypothetical protein